MKDLFKSCTCFEQLCAHPPSWPAYWTATNTEWLYQKLYSYHIIYFNSYNCPPEDEHIVVRNM